jgi:hypothetical protein
MQTQENLIEIIDQLVQLDIDAFHAYAQAADRAEIGAIRERLTEFQGEHERHVERLCGLLDELGAPAKPWSRRFEGFVTEGFVSPASEPGTIFAIGALRANEEVLRQRYQGALAKELDARVKDVLMSNCDDDARHREYLSSCLEEGVLIPGPGV